ncbi:hypothetical protein M6I34_13700 [Burkholderiaceae bacterium FT117]|uniref:Kelch repeat-containing protein n=1 Tax=Zeimonas sediminis TaxID=2944268 RepID=UPI002343074E|nr:kelch repeat-containing protein [Zeimonas sediminis]MCM5571570.1 hypothetical protein [Zeimonas sediminis]
MPSPARPRSPFEIRRRTLLLGAAACATLAACGGGGDSSTPAIQLSSDRSSYLVGEKALLSVRFDGDSARIEPGIGPVANGAVVQTPALADSVVYRLIVEKAGEAPQVRELLLPVAFRERFVELPTPFPVAYHAAVEAADGSVIVIGGDRGGSTLSADVDRFDPVTRSFTRIGSLATGRSEHSALRLADGRILVFGGNTGLGVDRLTELVNPVDGTVSDAGSLARSRGAHAATLLADGRALVVGGTNDDTAELWEPTTGSWRLLASRMSHPREGHSATLLDDGRVLIAGGHFSGTDFVFAEIFDPSTETFTPLASNVTERRLLHVAERLSDGSVLLLGGEILDGQGLTLLSSVLRFDASTNGFSGAAALGSARTLASGHARADGSVLLFGGQLPGEPATGSCVAWRADTQRALAEMPTPRRWHTLNRLPDGRLLVLGGEDQNGGLVPAPLVYE